MSGQDQGDGIRSALEARLITNSEEFFRHLPSDEQRDLQILKTHILLERNLRAYIDKKTLRKGNFGQLKFAKLLDIAEALSFITATGEWFWPAARALNKARNCLAHDLDDNSLDECIDELVSKVRKCHTWDLFGWSDEESVNRKALYLVCVEPGMMLGGH